MCPGHTLAGQDREEAWEVLKSSLEEICSTASRHQIQIAIEPADRYETDLVNTIADAAHLIEQVDRANLGVLLDSGHVHVTGESLAEAVQAAGERLFHVHVDDNQGLRDQHLIPGDGSVDFPELYRLLAKAEYAGFLCAELGWDYTVDPIPAARQTIERLRGYKNKNDEPSPCLAGR